jgi:hypothetical protein
MEHDSNLCNPLGPKFAQSQQDLAIGFAGKQYNPNQDYLDRVALEAMKVLVARPDYFVGEASSTRLAADSYLIASAMLKERSREVGE